MGDENNAILQFAKTAFEKVLTFEIDVLDNPIAQVVMAVVSEYTSVLPEWLIEEILKKGVLKLPEKIDTLWILKAAALGIVENANQENLIQAAKLLDEPVQRLVAKQIGKKLAACIAIVIASAITKKIMAGHKELTALKRGLVKIRQAARTMKGGAWWCYVGLTESARFIRSSSGLQSEAAH